VIFLFIIHNLQAIKIDMFISLFSLKIKLNQHSLKDLLNMTFKKKKYYKKFNLENLLMGEKYYL